MCNFTTTLYYQWQVCLRVLRGPRGVGGGGGGGDSHLKIKWMLVGDF